MKNRYLIGTAFLILALGIFSYGQTPKKASKPDNVSKNIAEISAGKDSVERGNEIREELKKIGVDFENAEFSLKPENGDEISGQNIIAKVLNPKAKNVLMLGAHYDRVAKGKGSVDNASGSAVILELLKSFKKKPLKNFTLIVAFWDKEEVGLVGSKSFVASSTPEELPSVYINFDVFGYGDTIWLWSKDEMSDFSKAIKVYSEKAKIKSVVSNTYPPSDHLSFSRTKTETYSFSLINEAEIPAITKLLKGPPQGEGPPEIPEILKIIHTPNDTLEKIDAKAVEKAIPVIEKAIRAIDKN